MTKSKQMLAFTALSLVALCTPALWSQTEGEGDAAPDEQQARFEEFSKKLSNCAMVGQFSIDGQDGQLKEERYELKSVTKMPRGDYWLFKARIRYGDHDVTVPLPLQVIWAESTPVITLDSVTIPGLGTFSARVLIDKDRYAGTWQHGDVGGHLFGRIKGNQDEEQPAAEESTTESDDEPASKS